MISCGHGYFQPGCAVCKERHSARMQPVGDIAAFITRDSGQRQAFPTGSVRDTREGKGRFDLLPTYALGLVARLYPDGYLGFPPGSLKRLAQLYERGAKKYGDSNWQRGQPLSRYVDSAFRHLSDYHDGDRKEDHLIAVAWNALGFLWTAREVAAGRLPQDLADWPAVVPCAVAPLTLPVPDAKQPQLLQYVFERMVELCDRQRAPEDVLPYAIAGVFACIAAEQPEGV